MNRLSIYYYDLVHKGLGYFLSARIKKRPILRKLYYWFKPSYVLIDNKKLFIDKADTVVSEALLNTGVWEPEIATISRQILKSGDLVLDIGAQIGDFTLLAALQNSRVIAFEPSKYSCSLLQKTITENHLTNITLIPKAVASTSGMGKLFLCADNRGDHRLYSSPDHRSTETVPMISLDDYFSKSKAQIKLIKIDIQGFEMQALLGMTKLLRQKRISNIISELWPEGLKLAGSDWKEYLSALKKAGFTIFYIDDHQQKLIPLKSSFIQRNYFHDSAFTINIFCTLTPNQYPKR